MICFAVALLYRTSGTTSISAMVAFHYPAATLVPSLVCLLIAAMTQSAIWPFQGWLLSSLNAPTPISALMHAGLVNGGGFLLARFAALYFKSPLLLTVIFTVGLITALLGTLWKLMQSDVKRMLACSTMAQMGFMIVQCGLGLFPTAVAHLCWHGLFKAYLFLASGSAAQEKRFDLGYPPRGSVFIGSLLCGLFGSMIFALASHKSVFSQDTTLLLILIAWISGSQFAIPILSQGLCKHFPLALLGTGFVSGLYGLSVYLITQFMTPLHLMHPQPLNIVHILGFILMFLAWLTLLLGHSFFSNKKIPAWILKMYVIMLNASQPNPKTVTSDRNSYHYL